MENRFATDKTFWYGLNITNMLFKTEVTNKQHKPESSLIQTIIPYFLLSPKSLLIQDPQMKVPKFLNPPCFSEWDVDSGREVQVRAGAAGI